MKEKSFYINKETNWFISVLLILFTTASFIMVLILIYGLIGTPSRISDLIGFLIVLVFAVFFALNHLLWQLFGKERLVFHSDRIEVKKTGTLISRKQEMLYVEIESIDFDNDNETPYWIRFWELGGGKIKINYLGRTKRLGQDLSIQAAQKLAKELQEELLLHNALLDRKGNSN